MRSISFLPLSLLTLLLTTTTACGAAAPRAESASPPAGHAYPAGEMAAPTMAQPPTAAGVAYAPAMPAPAPAAAMAPAAKGSAATAATSAHGAKSTDLLTDVAHAPLIIYAGSLQMRIDEERFASTIDKAIDLAESLGGYLAARKDASVELRVPSARFREALTKLEALAPVVHRSVSANDVSEEVHDAEVRLQNLRATRARLQEFLAKSSSIPDTLTVERELERVAQEIDHIEGRLQFLKARAAYSQIDLTLEPKPKLAPLVVTPDAPRRYVELPVDWLGEFGVDRLLTIR